MGKGAMKLISLFVAVTAGFVCSCKTFSGARSSNLSSATSANSSPPIVYTGITTLPQDNGTEIHLITRLHLIKTGLNPSGAASYRAIMIHHLGDDGSNEYNTYNYAFTTVDPQSRRLVLSAAVNTEASPKLPQVELTFDSSFEKAEGKITNEFISQKTGSVSLTAGWDYDKSVEVESRFGGVYEISCPDAPHGLMAQAKRIMITPNRFSSVVFDNAGTLDSDINYTANIVTGYFASNGRSTVAAMLNGGRLKLQQRRLTMMESRNEWRCDRVDQKTLSCNSSLYGICALKKLEEIHQSAEVRVPIQSEKVKVPDAPLRTFDDNVDCGYWDKTFYGYLKHRIGAKMQPMKISMRSLSRVDESGKSVCDLQVTGRLSFATRGILSLASTESENGTIIYKFPVKTIDPKSSSIQMVSSFPSEIILTIRRHPGCDFAFDWMSKIFGFVGDVIVSRNPEDPGLPKISKEDALQGLSDQFRSEQFDNEFEFMGIKTTPRLMPPFGVGDNNPFSGVEVGGWITLRKDSVPLEDSLRYAIKPDAFFDYYTNFFTLMTGNLLVGQVNPEGLVTRQIRGTPFSIHDLNFFRRHWTRIQVDNHAAEAVVATLQVVPAGRSIGGVSYSADKFYDLVLSSKDESIKRITLVAEGVYYSTTDWGKIGSWNRVMSRPVEKIWIKRNSVTLLILYNDDRLIQAEIPLQRANDLN